MTASPAKPARSKGVCALGTNDETAIETRARPGAAALALRSADDAMAAMAATSSSVSPGRPTMKYSFRPL